MLISSAMSEIPLVPGDHDGPFLLGSKPRPQLWQLHHSSGVLTISG